MQPHANRLCRLSKILLKLQLQVSTMSAFPSRIGQLKLAVANLSFQRPHGRTSSCANCVSILNARHFFRYFLKAIKWARKYGLRINLDLHALPGSQNGWNHSGRLGSVNVLSGPMGLANAQRSLDYIRIIAEFISQPQYSSVVTMFGITNEPQGSVVGIENLSR